MVTVTCTAGTQALVTLEGVPAAAPGQPAQLTLNATENDDRRGFFCDATLEVDGETLSKNDSTELRVLCELATSEDLPGPWLCRGGGTIPHLPPLASRTLARRRPPAGRLGLSPELDVARGPGADAALRRPREPGALGALRAARRRGGAGAGPAGPSDTRAGGHLPLHGSQRSGRGRQGRDADRGV